VIQTIVDTLLGTGSPYQGSAVALTVHVATIADLATIEPT
jgi:hypothetical protein